MLFIVKSNNLNWWNEILRKEREKERERERKRKRELIQINNKILFKLIKNSIDQKSKYLIIWIKMKF